MHREGPGEDGGEAEQFECLESDDFRSFENLITTVLGLNNLAKGGMEAGNVRPLKKLGGGGTGSRQPMEKKLFHEEVTSKTWLKRVVINERENLTKRQHCCFAGGFFGLTRART